MRYVGTLLSLLILSLIMGISVVSAQGELGPRLSAALSASGAEEVLPVWVFLADKAPESRAKPAGELVSERSLQRRRNVLPAHALVDETDLPVPEGYVAAIRPHVLSIRHRSRWLNAISVLLTPEQLESVRTLPFVSRIELIGRFSSGPRLEWAPAPESPPEKPTGIHSLDYGSSFGQLSQISVPPVHDSGNYGQGVIVGVFDDGFRLLNHRALDTLQIVATYDFVDGKVNVAPNPPGSLLGDHGINTLSTIAGYKPGSLIGPAFGASYILARTEDTRSETPVEEDNWVAAIEWADSIGVQVTSTSLGYLDFDQPFTSWTWQDMDGRTTVITRAVVIAARKGIVVVNSAGNNGPNSQRNTLNAPADADSILAAGSVNPDGSRTSFSSVGPTTDLPPRIKPDVMARGFQVLAASAYDTVGYTLVQGTSFSCPLTAGVAALLVAARPTATPQEIINALKNTASHASNPDNQFGWGIINAQAAIAYLTGTGGGNPPPIPEEVQLDQNYPNPFNPGTTIRFTLPGQSQVSLKVYDLLGREIRTLLSGPLGRGVHFARWDGLDSRGDRAASGAYVSRLETSSSPGVSVRTRKMILMR